MFVKLSFSAFSLLACFSLTQPSAYADPIQIKTDYEPRGQVKRSSLPHRLGDPIRWTEHRYDSLDRPVRLIQPDGSSVQTRYTPGMDFHSVETRDELGQRRERHFDAFGNEIHRDRFDGSTRLRTSYTYDALSRLTDIVDGRGSTFWYAYDGHGNRVFEGDPDLGCREFDHDIAGRLISQRSARGSLLSYTYDAAGRMTSKEADRDALQFADCQYEIVTGSRTASGGGSNDVLGAGLEMLSDVILKGKAGDDLYLIWARSGHVSLPADAEVANGGTDTVRFGDLKLSDLRVEKGGDQVSGETLVLSWNEKGLSGSLTIAVLGTHIERFEFSDGSAVSKIAFSSNDRLHLEGTIGDDLIIGSARDDQTYAGAGNDVIDVRAGVGHWQHARGQSGNDTYLIGSEAGNVWIMRTHDSSGHDTIRFKDLVLSELSVSSFAYEGQGEVLRLGWNKNGRSGELRLADMGQHIERFEFADGSAVSKIAFSSNDRLHLEGTTEDDLIIGSARDDQTYAGAGNDVIDVRAGVGHWQHARGQSGNDTYLIGSEAGNVWIMRTHDSSGHDTIRFKDLVLSELSVSSFAYEGQGEVLRLGWNKNGRSGELRLADMGQHIERFEFADGSAVSKIAFSSNDRLHLEGTTGDDLIIGSVKDDQTYAGAGNDVIDVRAGVGHWQHARGQSGNDTYLIGSEAGNVWIGRTHDSSGHDTVRFKDLVLSELGVSSFAYEGQGEVLRLSWNQNGRSGELRLADMGQHIERFEFADGSAVSKIAFSNNDRLHFEGTEGDDLIIGSPRDDQTYAGAGNDVIDVRAGAGHWQHARGQSGNDTYLIGSEAGNVWIMRTHDSSGHDTVRFKDLVLSELGASSFAYEGQGVVLRLSWNKNGRSGELRLADMGQHIERFEFADGSAVSKIAFSSNDRLHLEGSTGDDLIIGSARDDQTYGFEGNDTIDVGAGNGHWQHARGQSGDDTYLIGSEAGNVWIMREHDSSGHDTVRFKDLVLSELGVSRFAYEGQGEVLRFSWNQNGRAGELRLADMGQHIERFEFADGAVWTVQELWP